MPFNLVADESPLVFFPLVSLRQETFQTLSVEGDHEIISNCLKSKIDLLLNMTFFKENFALRIIILILM